MKTTLTKIITAALSALTLALSASAYTIPEYSFDYEQYMGDSESCSLCSEALQTDDIINDHSITITLRCEYSYFNSVWTIEDFPELQDLGIEFDYIVNRENWGEWTDEEIETRIHYMWLNCIEYHTTIDIVLAEEYHSYANVEKVKNAIVGACEIGQHPEFAAVQCTPFLEECEPQYNDLNGDEVINSIDVTMITRHALGSYALDDSVVTYADVNLAGSVNSIDATMLLRYVLKIDA